MNAAHQPTVHWLPELAPTLEARDAARALFEQQTGAAPMRLFTDEAIGVWGWIGADAVLLFAIPSSPQE